MEEENRENWLSRLQFSILKLAEDLAPSLKIFDNSPWVIGCMATFIILPLVWLLLQLVRRIRTDASSSVRAVKEFVAPTQGPRFRKRDKIEFMGRRVFRNAKVNSLVSEF